MSPCHHVPRVHVHILYTSRGVEIFSQKMENLTLSEKPDLYLKVA